MITIYGGAGCPWCERAKALAEDTGLKYEYKDVKQDTQARSEFDELFPTARTIPQIMWNGNHFESYQKFAEEVQNTRNYGDGPI
jgi:glutaredoxin